MHYRHFNLQDNYCLLRKFSNLSSFSPSSLIQTPWENRGIASAWEEPLHFAVRNHIWGGGESGVLHNFPWKYRSIVHKAEWGRAWAVTQHQDLYPQRQWKYQKHGTHMCMLKQAELCSEGSCCNCWPMIWVCLRAELCLAIPVSLSYALTQPSWNSLASHRLLRHCRSNQNHPSCQQYTRKKENFRYLDQHLWFTSHRCWIFVSQSYVFFNSYDCT